MFSYWARGYAFHGGVVALTTRDRNFAKKVLTGRDSICLVPRMNEAINRFISTAVPFWGQTTVISCVFPQNGTTTVLLPHEFRVVYPQTELTAVLKGLIPPPQITRRHQRNVTHITKQHVFTTAVAAAHRH